jgi:D-glycero-D-manno-heptose 1,7-bisphosphate phosphatase
MKKAVFLDRDGVLNRAVIVGGKPYPPASLEELQLLPGVPDALDAFRRAGFRTIVVTNQPDVATGRQRRDIVEAMHRCLRSRLALDDVYVCYHTDEHNCGCRKPKPGMLLEAARKWHLSLADSIMIGDRWRDVEAGHRAGCKTVWLRAEDYRERPPVAPHWVVGSLLEASTILCPESRVLKEEAVR